MADKVFLHCRKCLLQRPSNIAPMDWSRLDVSMSSGRVEVWCRRCKIQVGAFALAQPPKVECELCKTGEEHTHA